VRGRKRDIDSQIERQRQIENARDSSHATRCLGCAFSERESVCVCEREIKRVIE